MSAIMEVWGIKGFGFERRTGMTIKNITYRNRNDFKAVFQCDKCGHEFEAWGYSDANYYDNVIPNAICPKCGLNAQGETVEQLEKRLGRAYYI